MQLVLACPSGIAGNLWMAALLGLGADVRLIRDLPERLGVPHARVVWNHDSSTRVSEVQVEGTEGTPETDFRGLVSMVEEAGLPDAVRGTAQRVLWQRERAEARYLGMSLGTRRFRDEDVADTLLDVVGGILLWDSLGAPPTLTRGPVMAGVHPRGSSLELLRGIPIAQGGADLCLATPTGAALLRNSWQMGRPRGAIIREIRVPGDFSVASNLKPMHAALYQVNPAPKVTTMGPMNRHVKSQRAVLT
jgi:pyridinium-3,5-bisthiocarboxylic acid mononucleotide nickel chelatase